MRYFDRAAMFAEACQEYGFLSPSDEKNSILLKYVIVRRSVLKKRVWLHNSTMF